MTTWLQSFKQHAIKLGGPISGWKYNIDTRDFFLGAPIQHVSMVVDELMTAVLKLTPDVLVGTGVGGLTILNHLRWSAYRYGQDIPVLFVRDAKKQHGTGRLVEGPAPDKLIGKRVVFVDDLLNTGRTYNRTMQTLRDCGYDLQLAGIAVVIDYFAISRQLKLDGIPVVYLTTRHELGLTRQDANLPEIVDDKPPTRIVEFFANKVMRIKSSPVIDDSRVYIGSEEGNEYCFDLYTGNQLWCSKVVGAHHKGNASIAQFDSENVYWVAYDGLIRSTDKYTGRLNWCAKVGQHMHSGCVLDPNASRLFVSTEWDHYRLHGKGDIVCMSTVDGSELWRTGTQGMIPAAPCYSVEHSMVLCGSNDFHMYILNADDGNTIRRIPTFGEPKGQVVLNRDETRAFFATTKGYVYCIDMHAMRVAWMTRIGDSAAACNVHYDAESDLVVVSNTADQVIALRSATGNIGWVTQLRSTVLQNVIHLPNGLLAVGLDGDMTLLDRKLGIKLAKSQLPQAIGINKQEITSRSAWHANKLVVAGVNNGIWIFDTAEVVQ